MKARSLLLLRISLGLLIIWWGYDKIANTAHGTKVAEHFYFGILSGAMAIKVLGALQIIIGGLTLVGFKRNIAYPAVLAITVITAVAVWKSIIDPWGLFLEGSNVLFYPSFITAAAAFVLMAFMDEDVITIDK